LLKPLHLPKSTATPEKFKQQNRITFLCSYNEDGIKKMNPVGQTLIAMEPMGVYVLLPVSVHKLSVTHCNEATGAYLLLKSL
jgi:hypothetical protein